MEDLLIDSDGDLVIDSGDEAWEPGRSDRVPDLDNQVPRRMFVGDRSSPFEAVIRERFTGDARDLTSWLFVSLLLKERGTEAVVTGGGVLTFGSPRRRGRISYAWGASDTATTGLYDVYVQFTDANSLTVTLKDPRPLIVDPLPS